MSSHSIVVPTSSGLASQQDCRSTATNARCAVCGFDGYTDMYICSGCQITVHAVCYGVSKLPSGPWQCRKCERVGSNEVTCALCLIRGGALKPTDDNRWAHIACALWYDETSFGAKESLEPIKGLNDIHPERWSLTCSVCHTEHGASVLCADSTCATPFHPACALRLRYEVKFSDSNGIRKYRAYCPKHGDPERIQPKKLAKERPGSALPSPSKNSVNRVLGDEAYKRVTVWNPVSGDIVRGPNRPSRKNLEAWLLAHPGYHEMDESKLLDSYGKTTPKQKKMASLPNSATSDFVVTVGDDDDEEDDEICDVCGSGDSPIGNQIVFCEKCNVAVHQACYGITTIPQGDWLCRACKVFSGKPAQCCLCPTLGGAFKPTADGRWAHVVCTLWLPETSMEDSAKMEPVVGIEKINQDRYKLKCVVCDKKSGACIQCSQTQCAQSFHASCARRAGWKTRMEETVEGVSCVAYCHRHSSINPAVGKSKQSFPANSISTQSANSRKSGITNGHSISIAVPAVDTNSNSLVRSNSKRRKKKVVEIYDSDASGSEGAEGSGTDEPAPRVQSEFSWEMYDVFFAQITKKNLNSLGPSLETPFVQSLLKATNPCATPTTNGPAESIAIPNGKSSRAISVLLAGSEVSVLCDFDLCRVADATPPAVSLESENKEHNGVANGAVAASPPSTPDLNQYNLRLRQFTELTQEEMQSLEKDPNYKLERLLDANTPHDELAMAMLETERSLLRHIKSNNSQKENLRNRALPEVRQQGEYAREQEMVRQIQAEYSIINHWSKIRRALRVGLRDREAKQRQPTIEGEEVEEDADCCVCFGEDSVDNNPIVFCERCNAAMHQGCYGIKEIPEGDFFCRRCEAEKRKGEKFVAGSVSCVLCPNRDGAFKRTADGRWAHVACALWIPEIEFGDLVDMEPIINVDAVAEWRKESLCFVCKQKQGACIRCSEPNCDITFHPLCGWYHGLYMQASDGAVHPDTKLIDIELKAYCYKHVPSEAVSRNRVEQSLLRVHARKTMDYLMLSGVIVPKKRGRKKAAQQEQTSSKTASSGLSVRKREVEPLEPDRYVENVCGVCFEGRHDHADNQIVVCATCKIAVHQRCYGVSEVPNVPWQCDVCASQVCCQPCECCLCPRRGGALKPTSTEGQWAHLTCALWIPEVYLDNETTMKPIKGVKRISKERKKLLCCLCKRQWGACIQCSQRGCYKAFHPLCAQFEGCFMELSDDIVAGWRNHAFCPQHTTGRKAIPEAYKLMLRLRQNMEKGRLLTDMVRRREKLKRERVRLICMIADEAADTYAKQVNNTTKKTTRPEKRVRGAKGVAENQDKAVINEEESKPEESDVQDAQAPRKRGRPKKSSTPEVDKEGSEDKTDEKSTANTKRQDAPDSRRKSRRSAEGAEQEEEKEAETPRRGRSSKQALQETVDTERESKARNDSETSKQGRKRKEPETDKESDAQVQTPRAKLRTYGGSSRKRQADLEPVNARAARALERDSSRKRDELTDTTPDPSARKKQKLTESARSRRRPLNKSSDTESDTEVEQMMKEENASAEPKTPTRSSKRFSTPIAKENGPSPDQKEASQPTNSVSKGKTKRKSLPVLPPDENTSATPSAKRSRSEAANDAGAAGDASESRPVRAGRKAVDKCELASQQALYARMNAIYFCLLDAVDGDNVPLCAQLLKLPPKRSLPDYYKLVEQPIDMKMIRNNIVTQQYSSMEEFEADIALLIDNVFKANKMDTGIVQSARTLRILLRRLRSLESPSLPAVWALNSVPNLGKPPAGFRAERKTGQSAVGSPIRVFWPLDAVYYVGAITKFSGLKNQHHIEYADGEKEWVSIDSEIVQFGDHLVEAVSDESQLDENADARSVSSLSDSGTPFKFKESQGSDDNSEDICHLCRNAGNMIVCSNVDKLIDGKPSCHNCICEDCFNIHKWDWDSAATDDTWQCTHCRDACPALSPCHHLGALSKSKKKSLSK
eukprot:GILJ01007919.1.p1 GENE.GILJ01007919.1~~GILJ01007919.1.p1  ORF type:complete len:1966 (+),score=175.56 GILJ01007919.1:45-5942(+)